MTLSTERYKDKNKVLNILQKEETSFQVSFMNSEDTQRQKKEHKHIKTHIPTDPEYISQQNFALLLLLLLSLI